MKKVYAQEIHGGGGDGKAIVLSVWRNHHGTKFVKFYSIEAEKMFTISKAHFVGRFPETLKENK